ncbi:tRNA (adenine(58)-N(1))-methyltransferase non-catalytic subunit trm6 [Penicillium brasilianum]|uniref:tRNA (adenine(58)-N(1))-methyltransferase non-catalytic subunit TRM6 n=1 Tax=Penicillium brasilianum TaxID=104259 RepID=A0A1S9RVB1_PENBI|nr:tRNA (adenine(58)-N(1))-methyltransferase non-catalytic subunit trm6 [Penicillium brasilianum]
MHSSIRPNQFVVIQLPSDQTRMVKLVPNTIVQLGKTGSFAANQVIGRPFFFTFEILDAPQSDGYQLRVVPAEELHAEHLIEEAEADGEGEEGESDASTPMRTNRNIVDDASTQKLTTQEIEELKKEASGAGKDIVAKLLESHTNLDKKTAFSLAKYTLRKRKKYIRRFTVLPLDVGFLTNYLLEQRDAQRTMELRDEHVGLLGCLGNVHHGGDSTLDAIPTIKPNGRYFVVDETGGLVVAAMAERMGILYPAEEEEEETNDYSSSLAQEGTENTEKKTASTPRRKRPRPMSASGNTITVIHAYSQPNLSLLKYFGYDINTPDESHPLHTHLKTMSWLQLVDPSADPILSNEPPALSAEELAGLKASKRTAYHFKRNRWEKFRTVTDEARAGGFDGLIAATLLEPAGVLKHTIPLLSGSAAVAIYSPTIEPLTELVDLYSTARRTAFINRKRDLEMQQTSDGKTVDWASLSEEFPLDPTRLLPPTLHTTRVRAWQVLPGRTHPLMTGRGGAEGYLFHGVHVIPAAANIQAAGTFRKKRKVETTSTPASDGDVAMTS